MEIWVLCDTVCAKYFLYKTIMGENNAIDKFSCTLNFISFMWDLKELLLGSKIKSIAV